MKKMITYRDANDNDHMTARLVLDDAETAEIIGGYYGHINQTKELPGGRLLVEVHLAEAGDDGWEAGEWYVVDNTGVHHVCTCNGTDGISAVHDAARYDEINELDEDMIESYDFCGLQAEASAAAREDADEGDESCHIEITPNYYGDDHRNAPYLLAEENDKHGDPIEMTYEESEEWIDRQNREVYVTDHNEAGRPNYRIVKA